MPRKQQTFVKIPSAYPQLLELRKSKTAALKPNKYLKESTVLRYYQVIGTLHMMLLQRMVLGDATGLGKTLEIIAAYAFILSENPDMKLLVVCQKSAIYQWQEEFEKFTQGITTRVITNDFEKMSGSKARRMQYNRFQENVMIMNYYPTMEEYEMISDTLGDNYMVCFDECVAFKSRKTKTHFGCERIALRAKRVYGLSATIIKNGLEEVYGIYKVIVPGLFGNITSFRNAFCKMELMDIRDRTGKRRKIPKIKGYKNLDQFKQLIDPYFLCRKKEEVSSELPKLISRKIVLEMGTEQRKAYREALNGILYEEKVKQEFFEVMDLVRNGAEDEKTLKIYEERKEKYEKFLSPEGKKRGKLAALTYCQMVSNGPELVNRPGRSSKAEELERLLQEELQDEKIIIFSRFKSGLPSYEIVCERLKMKYVKITGDQSDTERREARLSFQDNPNTKIIFITTAGSASLNLQAASVLIFIDTPWSFGDLAQTIGRAQRIGSLREHVLLIHFVNQKTIDERVMNRVTDKKDLSDNVLGSTAEGALDFTSGDDNAVDDLFEGILEDAKEFK